MNCCEGMNSKFLLSAILLVSAFTHLWNPVGFPDIFFDEGIYMRRAVNLLDTGNPQESTFYDHPYMGQIVLAGFLKIVNFENITFTTEAESLKTLYLLPRIFMGLLAILDTFLVYKIAQKQYGNNIAIIAALLISVMPYTWVFRRVLLDSILLPFLLSSILFALYAQQQNRYLVLISGTLLGLAIFTKITAFAFIPLLTWIIYKSQKKKSDVLILLIPAVVIPSMWLFHSIYLGQIDFWLKDVIWQSQRTSSIFGIMNLFGFIDPVLFVAGMGGIAYAALKKNTFVVFWFAPFFIFISLIGYKQYFHWIPLIPIMCISIAIILDDLPRKFHFAKKKIIHYSVIFSFFTFGLTITASLIALDLSDNQFQAMSFVLNSQYEEKTVLASPVYTWVFTDIFQKPNVPWDYSFAIFYPLETQDYVLVYDSHYKIDLNRGPQMEDLLENSNTTAVFNGIFSNYNSETYPYSNLKLTTEADVIEIRLGSSK